jgi:hypothetical protein
VKDNAQCAKEGPPDCNEDDDRNWGDGISEGADNDDDHNGMADFRADGCKDKISDQETHGNSGICN